MRPDLPPSEETIDETTFVWSLKRILISAGTIALILGALSIWGIYLSLTSPFSISEPAGLRQFQTQTAPLDPTDRRQTLDLTGTVVAARQVDLRPLVAGQITWVHPQLRDGGRVLAGEILIRIDPRAYEIANAQAENAVADAALALENLTRDVARQTALLDLQRQQLANAEAELARRVDLQVQGTISTATLEQIESQTLAQRQAVASAENGLAQLADQRNSLTTAHASAALTAEQAAQNLTDTQLRAPFDALVLTSLVQQGQLASQGDLAARLVASDGLEVQARLDQGTYATLTAASSLVGAPVTLRWAGAEAGTVLTGRLVRQGNALDASAGGVPVFFAVDGAAVAAGLRPGAFVELSMGGLPFAAVYTVPREAYFDDLPLREDSRGGIYLTRLRKVEQTAHLTSALSQIQRGNLRAWLKKQDLSTLPGIEAPALAQDPDAETPASVAELYKCIPLDPDKAQDPDATPPEADAVEPDEEAIFDAALTAALCPPIALHQAEPAGATLVAYEGDWALIRPHTPGAFDGRAAIVQPFEKLAAGTWLRLDTPQP